MDTYVLTFGLPAKFSSRKPRLPIAFEIGDRRDIPVAALNEGIERPNPFREATPAPI
jgi:hypothetical protein